MKVESTGASFLSQQTSPRERNHQVQDVFSEVLEAAGRRGFESAQEVESDQPLEESIQTTWADWFDSERTSGRYKTVNGPDALKQDYGEILARAYADGGYVAPKDFLKGLSKDELKTVQNVQSLAEPIDVDGLSEEGALNLLLPAAAQVDINRDGLTQTGLAYGAKFPNSNTPAEVVEAWQEATAGLPIGERMTFEMQMMMPLVTANIFLNKDGSFSHRFEPGDPGFTNPLAEADYSYLQATQDQLDGLEFSKNQISKEQYERQTGFWKLLQDLLNEKDAR